MKKLLLSLLAFGLTIQAYSQIIKTEELSEVIVYATNYKYLNNVNSQEVASIPVTMLERKAAAYNIKNSDIYHDEYDFYEVTFYIPEGKILAAYDKDGKIMRTVEKYKDINLPNMVKKAVYKRFPGWTITNDVYLVRYHDDKGITKKYKLKLVNGDEVIRTKVDAGGNFL